MERCNFRRLGLLLVGLFAAIAIQAAIAISSNLMVELATNKACYQPGEAVNFTVKGNMPAYMVFVRYRHGSTVVAERVYSEVAKDGKWTWQPPAEDFMGYMVDLYYKEDGQETIIGTIAVDVSSDWARFPRYGFVANFEEKGDPVKKTANIYEEMAYLNRCHINGVQFQDWHWKHHRPVRFNDDSTLTKWYQDISYRWIGTDHVKKYIEVQHAYGMKSISYNLCFGAWKEAINDGVKEEWGIYAESESAGRYQDFHEPSPYWQSRIYLEDPSNTEWQKYMADRNDEIYANYGFDGFQIDQLGYRGNRYDFYNNSVDLPLGYASFINAMKDRHPDKRLIMNAVSGYGAKEILGTGQMDFCYNEVWGNGNGYGGVPEDHFSNLYNIIQNNDRFSNHRLQTVFAAYLNFDKADGDGKGDKMMNTPGVLLADAVMFALGGSHIELGDHMLCREYFPHSSLAMSEELKTAMIRYYDFMTAYQNLLRGKSSKYVFSAQVSTTNAGVAINAWPPKANSIVTFSKQVNNAQVIHFLNFQDTNDLSWRDLNGTRQAPPLTQNLPISMAVSKKITKVWAATPDAHGGALQELPFTQSGGRVSFSLPSLKYWTMVVMESGAVEDKLLVVGDATQGGWDTGKAVELWPNNGGTVFKATVYLEAGKQFKFLGGTDYGTSLHYNAEYENYLFNEQYHINTANLLINSNADYNNGANDYKFTVDETGNYSITVDLNTLRVQVNKVAMVTIGESGYATYSYGRPLDFSGLSELKAYIATGSSGSGDVLKLTVQNVTDVPAYTGLLLHGAPGEYAVPLGSGSISYLDLFVGTATPTVISEKDNGSVNFILSSGSRGIGFYRVKNEGTLPANKAYLSLPASTLNLSEALVLIVSGEATSISKTENVLLDQVPYYSVSGHRVNQPSKGVYIHHGKKILIKK